MTPPGALLLALLLAGCRPADGNALISASRLAMREGDTARVHVAAASSADIEYEAPPGITILPVTDATGPALDVTAGCDAAHGTDATLLVEVRDRRDERAATLVLAVTDNGGDTCLANIQVWDESCGDASCTDACGGPPLQPVERIAIGRGESRRICAHATALDPMRPLEGAALQVVPPTSAFESQPQTDGQAIIVHGAAWLVGPFQVTFTTQVAGLTVIRNVPLDVGGPNDLGIEVGPVPAETEFARTAVDIHVHRFPNEPCTISMPASPANLFGAVFRARLTDSNGATVDPVSASLPCAGAHDQFTLAVVPGIDAPTQLHVPLIAVVGGESATTEVVAAVTSRAENVTSDAACPASASLIACADTNGDGSLQVVLADKIETCVVTSGGWRQKPAAATNGTNFTSVFSLATAVTPQIYATDDSGGVLHLVWSGGQWTWQSAFATPVGREVLPMRSTPAGPADFLVAVVPPRNVRFVRLDGVSIGELVLPAEVGTDLAIGAIDLPGGGGQDLIVVGNTGTGWYPIFAYALDWSTTPPSAARVAAGVIDNMPAGASRHIATRGTTQQLVISFHASEFASAVSEVDLSGSSFSVANQYGGVSSLASAPGAGVLLGAATGALWTQGDNPAVTYQPIDPTPPTRPFATYGNPIAPCLGSHNELAGFAMRADDGVVRVSAIGITPETP